MISNPKNITSSKFFFRNFKLINSSIFHFSFSRINSFIFPFSFSRLKFFIFHFSFSRINSFIFPFSFSSISPFSFIFFLLIFGAKEGAGQVSITNTNTITESFTGYLGTNTYPTNWDMQGTGTSYGFRGTTQTSGTSGGWYGNNNMSFLGSTNAKTGTATWQLLNNSGVSMTGFSLSFTGMLWKTGSAIPVVRVYYFVSSSATFPAIGTTGWTELTSCAFSDATTNISTGATLSSGSITLSVPNGQYLYLRWIHPGNSNSDNLGWDEINFTPSLDGVTPVVNINSANPAAPSISIERGSINNLLYFDTVRVATSAATLNNLLITPKGLFNTGDISNLKLWYQSSYPFDSTLATKLSTISNPTLNTGVNFSSLSKVFSIGNNYLFLTADVACAASLNSTIYIQAPIASDFTFASSVIPTVSNSNGGTCTIIEQVQVPNITSANISAGNTQLSLSWVSPVGCYDDIMIVATNAASVSATPSGDGTSYTANTSYGSGTLIGNSYCIYKGNTSPVSITNLTNDVTYNFVIFTRKGTEWSTGYPISGAPINAVDGDYRTRQSGNWSTTSTWDKLQGGVWVASSDYPNSTTASVFIQNPHTVSFDLSPRYVKNLFVKNGGKLYTGNFNSSGQNNKYVSVYGNIVCDGTIGNGLSYDDICFNIDGVNDTLSGSGDFSCSRIRKNATTNGSTSFVINRNVRLYSSTTCLYNAVAGQFNVLLRSATTMNCIGSGNIGIDGAFSSPTILPSLSNSYGTFTIDGTCILDSLLLFTNNDAPFDCNIIIGSTGVVNAFQVLAGASGVGSLTPASHVITIKSGGKLNITGTNGISPFSLSYNTYDLQQGDTVQYSANGNVNVETGLTYQNLLISGSGTKTANDTLKVNSNLYLDGTLSLSSTPTKDLYLGGNFIRSSLGAFTNNGRTVFFTGSNDASITASGGQNFYSLVLQKSSSSNKLSLIDSLSISKAITVNSGILDLANKNVTLLSNASTTASFGPLATNGSINYGTGRFIIERYIPAFRKWQLLAAPINELQTIKNAWQEGNAPRGNSRPGYGTWITTNVSADVANGFDTLSPGGPSMKYYNSATNNYNAVTSTNDSISKSNGRGYFLYVRGDRSCSTSNSTLASTILRTKGKLFIRDITLTLNTDSFACFGNPYPSVINFNSVTRSSNISNAFYIWDPQLGGAYGLGKFRVCSTDNFGDYNVTPFSGTSDLNTSYTSAGKNKFIQSGQAFFVYNPNRSSGQSITFSESSKDTGSRNVFRPQPSIVNMLRINLLAEEVVGTLSLLDGCLVDFSNTNSNRVDGNDLPSFSSSGSSVSLDNGGAHFIVEQRRNPIIIDSIKLFMSGLRQRTYKMEVDARKWSLNRLDAFLKDNYTATLTPISLGTTNLFDFIVDFKSGSYASDRFVIVFKKALPQHKSEQQTITEMAAQSDVSDNAMILFPNPLGKDRVLHIILSKALEGESKVRIVYGSGVVVLSQSLIIQGNQFKLNIPKDIAAGVYVVNVVTADGGIISKKIEIK